MPKAARRASLYSDTGTRTRSGAKVLTRGSNRRPPQADLADREIDIIAGNFFVAGLQELGRKYETYMEITVVTADDGGARIAHPFKLRVDVHKRSFSAEMQGREIVRGVRVFRSGIEFQCRLTELDRIDAKKLEAIREFLADNDIPGQASVLLRAAGLPFNPHQLLRTLFGTVTLLDALNDDDRVWAELPKLDLRLPARYHLFEGTYALVQDPPRKQGRNPLRLYEIGGQLYTRYASDSEHEPFESQSYLTWDVVAA
jgi:hypothetical protein